MFDDIVDIMENKDFPFIINGKNLQYESDDMII